VASTSSFRVEVLGFQPPPDTTIFGGGATTSTRVVKTGIANGSDSEQFDAIMRIRGTLAASGTVDVDLQTDTDRFGVALAAADVAAGVCVNRSTTGGGTLAFEGGLANPWTALLDGTTPQIKLPPEAGFAFWGFLDATFPVAGGDKTIRLEEIGTTDPVDYDLQVWIRK